RRHSLFLSHRHWLDKHRRRLVRQHHPRRQLHSRHHRFHRQLHRPRHAPLSQHPHRHPLESHSFSCWHLPRLHQSWCILAHHHRHKFHQRRASPAQQLPAHHYLRLLHATQRHRQRRHRRHLSRRCPESRSRQQHVHDSKFSSEWFGSNVKLFANVHGPGRQSRRLRSISF